MSETGKKIVIIGGVACGPKAAARARRRDPRAEITVIEQGPWLSYAGCGLPYYIGGTIPLLDGLRTTQYGAVRDEAFFRAVKGIDARTGVTAESIDRKNKSVALRNIKSGDIEHIEYDALVIATGATPIRPPIEGLDHERVFSMHVPADAERLRALIDQDMINQAAFIGGGRIALEVTEAFFSQAVDSIILEREGSILPSVLDPEMAASVEYTLRNQGVDIRTSQNILRIERGEKEPSCRVITESGSIEVDAVIVSTGIRPNVKLAADAGLEIGTTGAIAVNERMQTSDPDIFAGGDCVECLDLVTKCHIYAPLGSTANRHGRVIGDSVTDGGSTFSGIVGTSAMKTMGVNIAATGITEIAARALGYEVTSCIVPWTDCAHFYPGGKAIMIKMVADASNGRLLGAQAVGPGDVTKRIDVLATALANRATIDDVADLDVGYAPPYSTALDGIAHAANLLRNKRDGLAKSITPMELRERMAIENDFILLDVREEAEVAKFGLEDSRVRSIPLSRLSASDGEISKDAKLICFCMLGMRSYEACRTLEGMGFGDVCFLEGGLRLWIETGATSA